MSYESIIVETGDDFVAANTLNRPATLNTFNGSLAAGLERETRAWAAELAQRSPVALQVAKQAFYSAEDRTYEAAFDYMNEAFARLCATRDATEGIKAFLEKRPAVWRGEN
jgi:enoyl-CoA hydratase/carnithine racemase